MDHARTRRRPVLRTAVSCVVIMGHVACVSSSRTGDGGDSRAAPAATAAIAPPAAVLDALDGPPAKAALAFIAALQTQDRQVVVDLMSQDMAKDFTGPQADETLRTMAAVFPPQLAVTGVVVSGPDKATVKMSQRFQKEGVPMAFTAGASIGTVLVDGKWKVASVDGEFGPSGP